MRFIFWARMILLTFLLTMPSSLLLAQPAKTSQLVPGSMDVHWNEGSPDCAKNPQPPLQVHAYNHNTYILRENLCSTFEAPFVYLLIGSEKALLIDSGDVADPNRMPLAKTVMQLLPEAGKFKLPLLVVHTHRHLDHRAGDPQFEHQPNVQVVGYDIESVKKFYHFTLWPEGMAEIDLGSRTVDVLPTPGHNETEVSFYDRNSGLFFSGDFLLPGRLLIDDAGADLASARRAAAFLSNRPVTFILGGHIEMNTRGQLFPWESTYHPDEHVLQVTKHDLLAMPAIIGSFNGFYTQTDGFTMMNSVRILIVFAAAAVCVLVGMIIWLIRFIRKRRARGLSLTRTAEG